MKAGVFTRGAGVCWPMKCHYSEVKLTKTAEANMVRHQIPGLETSLGVGNLYTVFYLFECH